MVFIFRSVGTSESHWGCFSTRAIPGSMKYVSDMIDPKQSQLDKFKEAARELETDDDPQHFKEKLAKVVKHKPVEKPK